jgi:transposase-like protein
MKLIDLEILKQRLFVEYGSYDIEITDISLTNKVVKVIVQQHDNSISEFIINFSKNKESVNMKRMCKCPNCRTLSPRANESFEDVKAEGFDCPNCGEEFLTPLNSPLIEEFEE